MNGKTTAVISSAAVAVAIVALLFVAPVFSAVMQAPTDKLGVSGYVVVEAFHPDGTKFYHHEDHNLITTVGIDFISAQLGGAGGTSTATWIGLSTDTKAAHASDFCISTTNGGSTSAEITTNGLQRSQGAYAHTASTNTFTVEETYTASGTHTDVQKAGLFTANASGDTCAGSDDGTMLAENVFTAVTLATNDQLTVTWTITLS